MNALDTLRLGDPAGDLVGAPLDARGERLLHDILASPISGREAAPAGAAPRRRRPSAFDRKPVLVTIAVAALVAGGAVAVIHAVPSVDRRSSPAVAPTSLGALEDALFATLPTGARDQPALTWTAAAPGAQGDAFDTTGRSIQLAAACTGGGAITITVSGRPDTVLDCTRLSTVGPIDLSSGDAVDVAVAVTAGRPRYVVKAVAIPDPTASTSTVATGCPATSAHMPAGAKTARIADVDGDGRPDTEWSTLVGGDMRFGITTASGATIAAMEDFAGGGDRSFVAAKLADGAVVLLPSEGRSTALWSLSGCSLHAVRSGTADAAGATGTFGISIAWNDDGGAATCIDGRLASLSWKPDGPSTDAVTARFIDVTADGATAALTDTETVIARHVDLTASANAHYSGISCGASPVITFP